MRQSNIKFKVTDILLICGCILPIITIIALKVMFTPGSEGISITGALIYKIIPMPVSEMYITEAQINAWAVIISIFFLCLYLTHGLSEHGGLRRQMVAEWIVEKARGLVSDNMGKYFSAFPPFIAAILALSAFSSLLTLFGLYPPTSDLNIIAGWAVLVFILITYNKLKGGILNYLKSFTQPFVPFTPFNIISEFATPISMSFRHYGNVLSGSVISALVAAGLSGLSNKVFGKLPGVLGTFPFFRVGIPAVLSLYFDIFSGCLQAFIFAMLTMLYISDALPVDEWLKKIEKRKNKHSK